MKILRLITVCLIYSVCSAYMIQGTYKNKMDNPNFDLKEDYHPSKKHLNEYECRYVHRGTDESEYRCGFFGDSENGFFIHNEFWCPPDYYCIENLTYPGGDCFLSYSDNDIHLYPYDGDNFPKECEK